MEKVRSINVYLNLWRILPAYLFFRCNRFKSECSMDLNQWLQYSPCAANKGRIYQFGYTLLYDKACRNIFLNRLHRNVIMYVIARLFFTPLDSCYLNMPPEKIGGGFSFQHGFSTVVAAKRIGQMCSINQQVTIGYKGEGAPVLGDGVRVAAGAIVIGDIKVGDHAVIGAGAVVTKDVPPYAVVGGVPARVLKYIDPEQEDKNASE